MGEIHNFCEKVSDISSPVLSYLEKASKEYLKSFIYFLDQFLPNYHIYTRKAQYQ